MRRKLALLHTSTNSVYEHKLPLHLFALIQALIPRDYAQEHGYYYTLFFKLLLIFLLFSHSYCVTLISILVNFHFAFKHSPLHITTLDIATIQC